MVSVLAVGTGVVVIVVAAAVVECDGRGGGALGGDVALNEDVPLAVELRDGDPVSE